MSENPIEDSELRSLMRRYQGGDPAAVDELVGRVSPPLLRYFGAMRMDREDAEDLLQECWIRIHRSRHTYRQSEAVMPWVYAIASIRGWMRTGSGGGWRLGKCLLRACRREWIGVHQRSGWRWLRSSA